MQDVDWVDRETNEQERLIEDAERQIIAYRAEYDGDAVARGEGKVSRFVPEFTVLPSRTAFLTVVFTIASALILLNFNESCPIVRTGTSR